MRCCSVGLFSTLPSIVVLVATASDHQDDCVSLIQGWKGSSSPALRPDYEIMDWHVGALSDLQYNNLGGRGPNTNDPPEIRYRNVSRTQSGRELDLVVTGIDTYWNHAKISMNGVLNEFGRIMVKKNKANRFRFRFVETETYNLVQIRAFDFTVIDLDQDAADSYCMEMVAVWGATGYYTVPGAYSAMGVTAPHWEDHESGITACSNVTIKGYVAEPKSAKTLSHAQAKAAVLFTFENTGEFQVGFYNKKLRGFMFAGTSDPLRWETGIWHDNFQPIVQDELAPGHGRVFHWNLDQQATVTANNLGGRGPNFDDPTEIRYANVGILKTHDANEVVVSTMMLDLVAFTESQYWGSEFINTHWNGANGEYGEIGLSRRSEATIIFTFVEHGTNVPKIVPAFDFTVFDIDNQADPTLGEEYTVCGASEYTLVPDSWTIAEMSGPECVKLTSHVTEHDGAIPNPTSWADLTEDQAKVTVQLRFYSTAKWTVHFKVTAITERAFLFGGRPKTSLRELGNTTVIKEAPTPSPTQSPTNSPTASPTGVPTTSPTASPTQSPTATPTASPTGSPSLSPTASPTEFPTASPTVSPTASPSPFPTASPSLSPTAPPTASPTESPSSSPTVSPTGTPTQGSSTVFGDPHVMNQHGEVFDVLRAGSYAFLTIPRGAQSGTEQLSVSGEVSQRGEICAGQLYLTHLNVTGQWLRGVERLELFTGGEEFNLPQSIGLKAGASGNLSAADFARALPEKMANVTTFQPERPKRLNQHVTTVLLRLDLGHLVLKINWEHQKEKEGFSNSLMLFAYGLGSLPAEVGGLLGKDDHDWVSNPPAQCVRDRSTEKGTGRASRLHMPAPRCCVRAAAFSGAQ